MGKNIFFLVNLCSKSIEAWGGIEFMVNNQMFQQNSSQSFVFQMKFIYFYRTKSHVEDGFNYTPRNVEKPQT